MHAATDMHAALHARLSQDDDQAHQKNIAVIRSVKHMRKDERTLHALECLENAMCTYYGWPIQHTDNQASCANQADCTAVRKLCLSDTVDRLDSSASQVTSARWPKGFTQLLQRTMCIRMVTCKHRNPHCDICHQRESGVSTFDLCGPVLRTADVRRDDIVSIFDGFIQEYDQMFEDVAVPNTLHQFDLGRLCMGDVCASYTATYWSCKHLLFDWLFDLFYENHDKEHKDMTKYATDHTAILMNEQIAELEDIATHYAKRGDEESDRRIAPPIPEIATDIKFWRVVDQHRRGFQTHDMAEFLQRRALDELHAVTGHMTYSKRRVVIDEHSDNEVETKKLPRRKPIRQIYENEDDQCSLHSSDDERDQEPPAIAGCTTRHTPAPELAARLVLPTHTRAAQDDAFHGSGSEDEEHLPLARRTAIRAHTPGVRPVSPAAPRALPIIQTTKRKQPDVVDMEAAPDQAQQPAQRVVNMLSAHVLPALLDQKQFGLLAVVSEAIDVLVNSS